MCSGWVKICDDAGEPAWQCEGVCFGVMDVVSFGCKKKVWKPLEAFLVLSNRGSCSRAGDRRTETTPKVLKKLKKYEKSSKPRNFKPEFQQ
jgi:hypothetical protein